MIDLIINEMIKNYIKIYQLKFDVKDIIKDHNFRTIYDTNIIECQKCKCEMYFSHSNDNISYLQNGGNIRIINKEDILTCDEIIIKQIIE